MEQGKHKNLRATEFTLENLKHRFNYIHKSIVELVGQSKYDVVDSVFTEILGKASTTLKALPLRHDYTDTFYTKKPYTIPTESVQFKGARASMREDLITWVVYNPDGGYYGWCREIFKDKKMTKRIGREDGVAIFESDKTVND
jgi:hypothetical protein